MSGQQLTLVAASPVCLFYEEVRNADNSLKTKRFTNDDAQNVASLIGSILPKAGGSHTVAELNLPSYAERWIETLLEADTNNDMIFSEKKLSAENLAENFANSMQTTARKKGKYVLIIMLEDRVVVCHSYTGKQALTTDMEIVEELLSKSNIDKFAEFKYADDGLIVNHYEKRSTQSFTDWLGIPANEVIYETRGSVNIYTDIDSIECVFEFNRRDVVEKLIGSDVYSIDDGILRTPNHNEQIRQIRWGGKTYDNPEDFKQEIFATHYKLNHYKDEYDNLRQSLDNWTGKKIIDREDKISIIDGEKETVHLRKNVDDIQILYVGTQIEMEDSWVTKIANQITRSSSSIRVCHMSNDITTNHANIGNLRVDSDTGLSEQTIEIMNQMARAAEDLGAANMANLTLYIVYYLLSQISNRQIDKFFDALRKEFQSRYEAEISDEMKIMMNENDDAGIEFKAGDWFVSGGNQKIVEKILDEFDKGSRIILGGVDEGSQEINALSKGKYGSDRMNHIAKQVSKGNGYTEDDVHIWTIPIGSDRCLIGAANTAI